MVEAHVFQNGWQHGQAAKAGLKVSGFEPGTVPAPASAHIAVVATSPATAAPASAGAPVAPAAPQPNVDARIGGRHPAGENIPMQAGPVAPPGQSMFEKIKAAIAKEGGNLDDEIKKLMEGA